MKSLHIYKVGDGLCADLGLYGGRLHIDCGDHDGGHLSSACLGKLWTGHRITQQLVLSHFHLDHVSGYYREYANCSGSGCHGPYDEVFFPRMPCVEGSTISHDDLFASIRTMLIVEVLLRQDIAAAYSPLKRPPKLYQGKAANKSVLWLDIFCVLDLLCGRSLKRSPKQQGEWIDV